MKRKGWSGESQRHSLSAKGIQSSYNYSAKGKPRLIIGLPSYTKEKLKMLNEIANGKEWIAELIIVNESIFIDDIRVSDQHAKSWLNWNSGDDLRDVGYIHYHPPGIIPEFSAQDFILVSEVHKLRKNKEKYPYTIMGLVYPKGEDLQVILYGYNGSKSRQKDFETKDAKGSIVAKELVESDMQDIIDDMIKKKELLKLSEVKL